MLDSSDIFLKELIVEKDNLFAIRNYQRHYVWTEERVSVFFHDICNTSHKLDRDPQFTHFFGQMILRDLGKDRRDRTTYEVIDGQQRLTTLILLFVAFHGKLEQLKQEFPGLKNKINEEQQACLKYFCSQKEGANERERLSLSDVDNTYFKAIIASLRSNNQVDASDVKLQSHKALFQAQNVLTKLLSEDIDQFNEVKDKLNRITLLRTTASERFQVVAVWPTDEKYTFQLYQVVNDRGQPLTDCELLKAKTIEVLAGNQNATEKAKLIWNDLLNDSGITSETYLKWCYMSKLGKDKDPKDRYYQVYLRDYFCIEGKEQFSTDAQEDFLRKLMELKGDIEYCRKLSKGTWPIPTENSKCMQWQKSILPNLIVSMRHTLCIPVLISGLRAIPKHGDTTETVFFRILELCETFFMLYKGVFDFRETKFKNVYLKAARDLRDPKKTNVLSDFKDELCGIEKKMDRRECFRRLNNLSYIPKAQNKNIKYLLILLETYYPGFSGDQLKTKNIPDGRKLEYNELSVEHIYDKNLEVNEQDPCMEPIKQRLGNLVAYGGISNSKLPPKYIDKKKYYQTCPLLSVGAISSSFADWSYNEFTLRQKDVCAKLSLILMRFFPSNVATQPLT